MGQDITTRNHRQMITILTRIPTKNVIPAEIDTIHTTVRLEILDITTIETMTDGTTDNIIHTINGTATSLIHKSVIVHLVPAVLTSFQSTDRHPTTKISFLMIYSILVIPNLILRNRRTRITQDMTRVANPQGEGKITVLDTADGPIRNIFAGTRNHHIIRKANNTELLHNFYLPITKVSSISQCHNNHYILI